MQVPKLSSRSNASVAKNLALMLEVACENFETLQRLVRQEMLVVSHDDGINNSRATSVIQMALAKNFIFHVVRARRICEHGAGALNIDRTVRKDYMRDTAAVVKVRDVNEHGFDCSGNKNSKLDMHAYYDGRLAIASTALAIIDNDKILVGPINLYEIYLPTNTLRKIAGFSSLHKMSDGLRQPESEADE